MQLRTTQQLEQLRLTSSARSANPVRYAFFAGPQDVAFAFSLPAYAHVGYEWQAVSLTGAALHFKIAGIAEFGHVHERLVFGFGVVFVAYDATGVFLGSGELLLAPDHGILSLHFVSANGSDQVEFQAPLLS